MRATLVAANWKMYKDTTQTAAFFDAWAGEPVPDSVETAFFPPFPLLSNVKGFLDRGESLGAQNCHEKSEGAFTGEVSAHLLRDLGCRYVLIGHSERRHIYGEAGARLAEKFAAARAACLRPVLCVGETLEQRERRTTLEVVLSQLVEGLGSTPPQEGFDLAYEPVWAIGTGKVATPEDATEVQSAVRNWLIERGVGKDARILYGGSVKPENAAQLLAAPSVEGLLVGGASLDPQAFAAICRAGQ